jgi:hypothetical protein
MEYPKPHEPFPLDLYTIQEAAYTLVGVHYQSLRKEQLTCTLQAMRGWYRPSLRPSDAYFALSVYNTLSHDVGGIILAEDLTDLAS